MTNTETTGSGAALDGCGPECACRPLLLPRRTFLSLTGLTLAATLSPALPAMAGPFAPSDFETLIPPDKKLRPEWVESLFARGKPTVYTKSRGELNHIGMPIGGICCGTVYLGGDGKLWLWDIFNENKPGIQPRNVTWKGFAGEQTVDARNGGNYVVPAEPRSPFEQNFAVKIDGVTRTLDTNGWNEIAFTGQYPVGTVRYHDPSSPVAVVLNAYSPFIPLQTDDSGLPATICEFTVQNTSDKPVMVEMAGWMENAASLFSAKPGSAQRFNHIRQSGGATTLTTELVPVALSTDLRRDVPVADFEKGTYGDWRVEGTAFGTKPVKRSEIPGYQGNVGGEGEYVVNSHASAPADTVEGRDNHVGKLTSPPFRIERKYLAFYIGGGANVEEVGLRLLVDGKVVHLAAGHDNNRMQRTHFGVEAFAGKMATIEIYDNGRGGWGHIGVDAILQTDNPELERLETATGFGTMALALLGKGTGKTNTTAETVFDPLPIGEAPRSLSSQPVGKKLVGAVLQTLSLAPGKSRTVTFVIAWHFPNSGLNVSGSQTGNYYAKRFANAAQVVDYVIKEYPRLSRDTKLWHKTWYDSTLPHWFLERTFVNTSILATTTAHRFANGRFWGWEGIGCCEGTCTHVWHYAQAVGRIFPEIERHHRETVDFGSALDQQTGMIGYRGEGTGAAVDGQCGRILGVYREHQMSADPDFLRRIWPNVQTAMGFLMHHDRDNDGLLDGAQENTLDAAWFGKIAWISSLYAAALQACERMAEEVGDTAFAAVCKERFQKTKHALETELFNGEYFIQKPEPGREKSLGTYQTCHIDQVHGQSWAWQVGLGRVLDRQKTVRALKSLYTYNFAPDVGPFRSKNVPGRPYALPGDAGLIMATNPKELPNPYGNNNEWQYGYFNECMSGFEHQVASHMIAEGLVQEGLALTRAIHDRYHAARRNPFNEIECSDHYSRAMASYGSFLTACGFAYHGPKKEMAFAPRLPADDFRAAFTAAEGWGTYAQKRTGKSLKAEIHLRYGKLHLQTLTLEGKWGKLTARSNGKSIPVTAAIQGEQTAIRFSSGLRLEAGQSLVLTLA